MKTCFFIGHREADEGVYPRLRQSVERLIAEEKVSAFYVGSRGGFDRLAAHAVIDAKRQYPNIVLMLVLPYHPGERPVELPNGFDGTYYPEALENTPRRFAIVQANKIMVDTSDWLICYVWHPASNARNLLEYARRREKRGWIQIENLAEEQMDCAACRSLAGCGNHGVE